jgi:hypothetical protein
MAAVRQLTSVGGLRFWRAQPHRQDERNLEVSSRRLTWI